MFQVDLNRRLQIQSCLSGLCDANVIDLSVSITNGFSGGKKGSLILSDNHIFALSFMSTCAGFKWVLFFFKEPYSPVRSVCSVGSENQTKLERITQIKNEPSEKDTIETAREVKTLSRFVLFSKILLASFGSFFFKKM